MYNIIVHEKGIQKNCSQNEDDSNEVIEEKLDIDRYRIDNSSLVGFIANGIFLGLVAKKQICIKICDSKNNIDFFYAVIGIN